MIEFKNSENQTCVACEGTGITILADLLLEINLIYKLLQEQNPAGAKAFKSVFKDVISDDLPFLSDDEMEAKVKAAKSDVKAKIEETLLNVIKMLEDE